MESVETFTLQPHGNSPLGESYPSSICLRSISFSMFGKLQQHFLQANMNLEILGRPRFVHDQFVLAKVATELKGPRKVVDPSAKCSMFVNSHMKHHMCNQITTARLLPTMQRSHDKHMRQRKTLELVRA